MLNYRFYSFDAHDRITAAHVVECDGVDDLQRRALSFLADHPAAAAVEVWDRDKLVYRSERPKTEPVSITAA
jgi:hypothetical protein